LQCLFPFSLSKPKLTILPSASTNVPIYNNVFLSTSPARARSLPGVSQPSTPYHDPRPGSEYGTVDGAPGRSRAAIN
jgi:hypothetical protein